MNSSFLVAVVQLGVHDMLKSGSSNRDEYCKAKSRSMFESRSRANTGRGRGHGVGGQETEAGALIRGWLDSAARSPRLLRTKKFGR